MKRKLLAICLAGTLLLAGCGGGGAAGGAAENQAASSAPSSPGAASPDWNMDLDMPMGEDFDPEMTENGSVSPQTSSIYQNTSAKLIRRADLSIQTEQFDQSVEALNRLVASCGGYFENASVYGGGWRDAYARRSGDYTVRVPAEKYDQFLSSTGDLGYVTSKSESSEDVGERYYDTEARLKTQRTKQERLLALLERAESMEDIIALESALSEVEYQIEQYSSELNRYDALIGFSTFQIYLDEVGKVTQDVGDTASLGQRMAAGLQSSVRGLVQGSQDLLIWISYNLFLVVVLAVCVTAGIVLGRRKLRSVKRLYSR